MRYFNRTAASISLVATVASNYASAFTTAPTTTSVLDHSHLHRHSFKLKRTFSFVNKASANDFDDFAPSNDDNAGDDGKDLAREFYKQVQKRELAERKSGRPSEMETNMDMDDDNATWEVAKKSSSSSKKFTGRRGEIDSSGTPSAGLFASQNGSVYASSRRSAFAASTTASTTTDMLSPRDRMMRDEINFMRIASNEATIVVQAILVVILLCFTLYIGSTGGITDGSDRFGAMEGMVNEFNGLGESIDFSSLITDDAAVAAGEVVKEGSLWL